MPRVIYAECYKQALNDECHYAECRGTPFHTYRPIWRYFEWKFADILAEWGKILYRNYK